MSLSKIFHFLIKTPPAGITVAGIGSLIFLVIKPLYLDGVPQPFHGMHDLGNVSENIAISILASYLFYMVVAHPKEYKEKIFIYSHVQSHILNMEKTCHSILIDAAKKSNISIATEKLEEPEIKKVLSNIDPYIKDSPLKYVYTGYVDWFAYLVDKERTNKRAIEMILKDREKISLELAAKISNLKEIDFFTLTIELGKNRNKPAPAMNNQKIVMPNLGVVGGSFYKYYESIKELKLHFSKDKWAKALNSSRRT